MSLLYSEHIYFNPKANKLPIIKNVICQAIYGAARED